MIDINSLRERDNTEIFSVYELNNYIKNLLESSRTLSGVAVRGEISNFVCHRSGHLYFSLKDSEGQIRCVMFKSKAASLKFMPESGMKVLAYGSVSAYPRDGAYQLYVSSMQPDGIGALYLAYEQLKQRLQDEGLFDREHKLPLPHFPRRIGVITSPTGAAVRDIINVTGRRYPGADIYLYPSLVQGEGAEASLISALDYLDRSRLCDVIIIGRGGGSIEDLWAFNSEKLARRIYEAATPVISAVGHETDFTICDFVADMRAPTPSAAAELCVPDKKELLMRLDSIDERLSKALLMKLRRSRERLDILSQSVEPARIGREIDIRREKLSSLEKRCGFAVVKTLTAFQNRLRENAAKANALSPLSTLSRGYSLAEIDGRIIKSVKEARVGDSLRIVLSDGAINATVEDVK